MAFTVDAANFLVVFYVDGAYVTKKLVKQSCTKVAASRSDGKSVDEAGPLDGKLGAAAKPPPAKSFLGANLGINLANTAKSNDAKAAVAEGDASREFKFRPRHEYRAAYSSFAMGGLYDVHNDRVTQPFQGAMDQVAYYRLQVPDKDIKRLSEDVPCAQGFNGDGYAFFPGTSAENGEEMILTGPIAGCDVGLHTVRFRYLASQANGVKLDVQSSDTTRPVKVVEFVEPAGLDDTVLNRWGTSAAAVFAVNTETPLALTISAHRGGDTVVDAARRRRRAAAHRRRLLATTGNDVQSSLNDTESMLPKDEGKSVYDRLNPQDSDTVPAEQFLPDDLKQSYEGFLANVPRFNPDASTVDDGKVWIQMDDLMKWTLGLSSEEKKVNKKVFPPPPPALPSPPPVEVAAQCLVADRGMRWDPKDTVVHVMSDAHHTNSTQRMISDLKCNYNTPYDRVAWNPDKWGKIAKTVYLQDAVGALFRVDGAAVGRCRLKRVETTVETTVESAWFERLKL